MLWPRSLLKPQITVISKAQDTLYFNDKRGKKKRYSAKIVDSAAVLQIGKNPNSHRSAVAPRHGSEESKPGQEPPGFPEPWRDGNPGGTGTLEDLDLT